MATMSPATALRQIQQAQARLKKARLAIRLAREANDPTAGPRILKVGWEGLAFCHQTLAEIPLEAATEPVLTKGLALQRYATALLVRLRRIVRNEPGAMDGLDTDEDDES